MDRIREHICLLAVDEPIGVKAVRELEQTCARGGFPQLNIGRSFIGLLVAREDAVDKRADSRIGIEYIAVYCVAVV